MSTPATTSRTSPSRIRALLGRRETHLAVLLIVLALVAGTTNPYFLTSDNIFDLTSGLIEKALVALPLALLIVSGEIDISVESMMGLGGAVFGQALVMGAPVGVAFALAISVGAIGGLLNGILVTRVGLPSLVVTLGTFALFRGLAYVVLGPTAVSTFPQAFTDFTQGYIEGTPIPLTVIPLVIVAVTAGLLLASTRFGRWIYFIGRNDQAARLAGVRVAAVKTGLFIATGTISAAAGVLLSGRLSSARADNAQGFVLDILTAVILGGVAIAGGEGSILGVVLAVLGIGAIENVLTLSDVDPTVQTTVVGALLVVSVVLPRVTRRLRRPAQITAGRAAPPSDQ